MDKEAQEMVAALEMRIKEEPEDEEEEEDRTEGEEDMCDGSLRMNGESHKFKSGESLLWVGCHRLVLIQKVKQHCVSS
jgi:hypothetical protein